MRTFLLVATSLFLCAAAPRKVSRPSKPVSDYIAKRLDPEFKVPDKWTEDDYRRLRERTRIDIFHPEKGTVEIYGDNLAKDKLETLREMKLEGGELFKLYHHDSTKKMYESYEASKPQDEPKTIEIEVLEPKFPATTDKSVADETATFRTSVSLLVEKAKEQNDQSEYVFLHALSTMRMLGEVGKWSVAKAEWRSVEQLWRNTDRLIELLKKVFKVKTTEELARALSVTSESARLKAIEKYLEELNDPKMMAKWLEVKQQCGG